jgi:hypothetical protein
MFAGVVFDRLRLEMPAVSTFASGHQHAANFDDDDVGGAQRLIRGSTGSMPERRRSKESISMRQATTFTAARSWPHTISHVRELPAKSSHMHHPALVSWSQRMATVQYFQKSASEPRFPSGSSFRCLHNRRPSLALPFILGQSETSARQTLEKLKCPTVRLTQRLGPKREVAAI